MRPAGDPEDLAGGQLPVLLVGAVARALLELAELAAERGEVLLLGHLPGLAQPLEEVAQGRPPGEPDRVDLHEVGQRRVEEPEPPVLVEDREPDRQMGEGLGQRLDEAPERRLGGDEVVGVEREAEGLAGRRPALWLISYQCGSASSRPGTETRRRLSAPRAVSGTSSMHVAEGVGDAVVGQLARGRVEAVAVGGVRPGDLAVRPVAPGEHRRPVEHVAQEAQLGAGAVERRLGVLQRARLLARRADRQVGGAAARLAEDLEGGRRRRAGSGGGSRCRRAPAPRGRPAGPGSRRRGAPSQRGEPRAARREAVEQRPRRLVQRLQAPAADQVVAGPRRAGLRGRGAPPGGQPRGEARDERRASRPRSPAPRRDVGRLEPTPRTTPSRGRKSCEKSIAAALWRTPAASEASRLKEG